MMIPCITFGNMLLFSIGGTLVVYFMPLPESETMATIRQLTMFGLNASLFALWIATLFRGGCKVPDAFYLGLF